MAQAIPDSATIQSQSRGLVRVLTPGQVTSLEQAERAAMAARVDQQKPELLSLAADLQTKWQAAKTARQSAPAGQDSIDQRMIKSVRQRVGVYDPDKLAKIKNFGGSEVYMMLTNVKSRACESWIRDIEIPPGEKPWSIDPTAVPDLPEADIVQIQNQVIFESATIMTEQRTSQAVTPEQIADRLQEIRDGVEKEKRVKAKKDARRLERHIEDDLQQGNFYEALGDFITDISTYPTAFLKGPVVRRKKSLVWTHDQSGNWVPAVDITYKPMYYRVSPFYMYPSPGAKTIQDGYLFEFHQLSRGDLLEMKGVSGFNDKAIDGVLLEYGNGGLRNWTYIDQEKANIEGRPTAMMDSSDDLIDALEFWGSVQGKKLLEWGMSPKQVKDPTAEYQITAWLIGGWVIMARINPHPLGLRPYYAASFESIVDSIWGKSVPELMRDIQDICNGAARAMVNNMGIASGPQVEVEMDRMKPGENIEDIYPWKIWKTLSDPNGGRRTAIQFWQPDDRSAALLNLYDHFFQQASEQTGIPAYTYGNERVGGAGKTASGLGMLMNAAGKIIKGVVANIDKNVIKPAIHAHWVHVMLYGKNELKMGDINIVARASEHLVIQEMLQMRRNEWLQTTNNPVDNAIIGPVGRAEVLRETVKGLKLPSENIIPSREDMEAKMNAPPPVVVPPGGAPAGGPPGSVPPGIPANMPGAIPHPAVIDAAGNRPGGQQVRGMVH